MTQCAGDGQEGFLSVRSTALWTKRAEDGVCRMLTLASRQDWRWCWCRVPAVEKFEQSGGDQDNYIVHAGSHREVVTSGRDL